MATKVNYRRGILFGILLGGMFFFFSCSCDYLEPTPAVSNPDGLRISIGGPLTRSANADAVLREMRLYCFDRSALGGAEPAVGSSSAYAPTGIPNPMAPFHHIVQGLTKSGMTLYTSQMRTGNWDIVMVSPQGATFTAPIAAHRADQLLMYTYDPADNQGLAHEFYYNYCRLPVITQTNNPYVNTSVSRNVAKVRIVVERAVDVDAQSTAHTITLNGIPKYISWAGTLLKDNGSGAFTTEKQNFDIFAADNPAFTKKVTFSSAAEAGTYKSDTIDLVIPAHRSSDFWQINPDNNMLEMNPHATDTITRKMTLSVNFAKASGGTFQKNDVEIPLVARCNGILLVKVRMKDTNVEIKSDIQPWSPNNINGNVGADYLNVSTTSTEVYDAASSRIHFWTNSKNSDLYVESIGADGNDSPVSDINTVFYNLAGVSAFNRTYNETTGEGYIDINQLVSSDKPTGAQQSYKIQLRSGKLTCEITVKRQVSDLAARKLTTPYVGTFHRWNQTGERIVTWENTGEWNAQVEGNAASQVLIDKLASPDFGSGALYTDTPSNPESMKVTDGGGSVRGNGRIYFRIGWKGSSGNKDNVRYAKVVVRTGSIIGSGTVLQTVYLRQGDAADYLMRSSETASGSTMNSRPNATKYTPYNMTAAIVNGGMSVLNHTQLPVYGGIFTEYPSQAGCFFQWARNESDLILLRRAYHPVEVLGALSGWGNTSSNTDWSNHSADNTICPEGYNRPHDGPINDTNITNPQASNSELRQSLFLQPQNGTSTSSTNSQWGYYADGFFDRRNMNTSVYGSTGSANTAVSFQNANVAYIGRLYYNPATNASIFFPAAGYRNGNDGSLVDAGVEGYFWTSTSYNMDNAWTMAFSPTSTAPYYYPRTRAFNLRCVEAAGYTLTFYANGGTFENGLSVKTVKVPIGSSTYLLEQPINTPMGSDDDYAIWSTSSSEDLNAGNSFSPNLKVTPTGNTVYYARWSNSRLFYGHNGWAGSNVYWDGTKLTFDGENNTANEQRQGVYFMWGSLVALSPMGNPWNGASMILHIPNTDMATNGGWDATDNTKKGWGYIPRLGWKDNAGNPSGSNPNNTGSSLALPIVKYANNQSYLLEDHNAAMNVGDVCKYITDKGWAPGANETPRVKWRMPINTEFTTSNIQGIGMSSRPAAVTSNNPNGQMAIATGWRFTAPSAGPGLPFFPASGYREWNPAYVTPGNIETYTDYAPGQAFTYWTGSQIINGSYGDTNKGAAFTFIYVNKAPTNTEGFERRSAGTVRCVRVN